MSRRSPFAPARSAVLAAVLAVAFAGVACLKTEDKVTMEKDGSGSFARTTAVDLGVMRQLIETGRMLAGESGPSGDATGGGDPLEDFELPIGSLEELKERAKGVEGVRLEKSAKDRKDGKLILGETATQRQGIQPVVTVTANGLADKVDVAVLVPNCPVCHQTSSLVARHLEAHGISTVVMGCAKDIVEHASVPRFLFSDFPLGNSAGKPHDIESQALTTELALRLLETASGARTTMQSPLRWSEDASWKLDYNNIAQMSPEELARRRAEFDKQKEIARGNRAA